MADHENQDGLDLFALRGTAEPAAQPPVEEPLPAFDEEVKEAPPTRLRTQPLPEPPREESFGEYLKKLRLRNGFTIDQIAEETRIKGDYLQALEEEDYSRLPQPVYILGYVRKLCGLYHVPADQVEKVTAELRDRLEYEVPEDISKSVIDHEVSEETERRVRQLALILIAAVLGLVVLLVAVGLLIAVGMRGRGRSQTVEPPVHTRYFNEAKLLELQPAPRLESRELKN